MIWLFVALLASSVALALILPFITTREVRISDGLGVFNGQLAELERDRELGLISDAEARRSVVEIKRRLLRASEQVEVEGVPHHGLRRGAIIVSTLAVAGAVAIYMAIGSPQLIGQQAEPQPQLTADQQAFLTEVDALAADLIQNPENPAGWSGLGQAYMAMGRYDEAAIAFNNAINLVPDSAPLFASLGEAYLFGEGGNFTPSSREAFQRALELDPNDVRARFFIAEAVLQAGEYEAAVTMWQQLIASLEDNDPVRAMIQGRLDALPAQSPDD